MNEVSNGGTPLPPIVTVILCLVLIVWPFSAAGWWVASEILMRRKILRMRLERMALLFEQREVRNAARLLREVEEADFTGSKELHP